MSKTVNLKVSKEVATSMLPLLLAQRATLKSQMDDLDEHIKKIQEFSLPSNGITAQSIGNEISRRESGRAPRGASKVAIINLLKERVNEDLSINDVSGMTGVNKATAYRVLNQLLEDGFVFENQGLWRWQTS